MPKILFLGIFSLFFLSSCHYISKKSCKKKHCGKSSVVGQASIASVTKGKIKGEVTFKQVGRCKVEVTANVKGLKPNQKFGFHVHEFGNCENKALMAGGHLNPWKKKHGSPKAKERHMGDLGNLESDANGQAVYSAVVKGKNKKFFGRSVIIHALPDDLTSQPTGSSGDRIACGVITVAMPPAPEVKEAKDQVKAPVQKTVTKNTAQPEVQKTSAENTAQPEVQKAAE